MGEQLQHISVMTDASSGGLVFELETSGLTNNLLLTIPVTGIINNSEPKATAAKIESQFNTLLAASGASFTHIYFTNQNASGEFNVTRSDHVVTVMSQSDFEIRLVSSSCKAKVEVGAEPLFATVQDMRDLLTDTCSDDCATDASIILKIKRGSSWLISYLNNNRIVRGTYIHHFIGGDEMGVLVKNKPLVSYYEPAVKAKYPSQSFTWINPIRVSLNSFSTNDSPLLGFIAYRGYQQIVDMVSPYEDGNEIVIAYIAGEKHIPQIIKDAVAKFVYFQENMGDTETFSVEGASETTRTHAEILGGYRAFLSRFKL